MKKIIVLIVGLITFGCSSTQHLTTELPADLVDLDGVWVGDYNDDLQFVLQVNETDMRLKLKIMGKPVTPLDYKKRQDQAIIKFKNTKEEVFFLLAQINQKEQMRLSITSEEVSNFMPIGMLGEKVFNLSKLNNAQEKLNASVR